MKTAVKIKIIVPSLVLAITLSGQLFNSVVMEKSCHIYLLPIFLSYSLISALISYFTADLTLFAGNLRKKIQFIKLLVFYLFILITVDHYLLPEVGPIAFFSGIQLSISVLFSSIILLFSIIIKAPESDFIPEKKQLPGKYLRPHPIRTVLETVFRLFPLPEPVALYEVGNPDHLSPVIVTGNYELTVRRVAGALNGLDCWLLICDSRGVNVWCSTLSGHFSQKSIIRAIEFTNLFKYISHRNLILPQFAAAGMDVQVIKKETGATAIFGPAYIEDIKAFLNKSRKESELRGVRFDIRQRMEMALGSSLILTGLLSLIFLFIGLSRLPLILTLLYLFILIHTVIYPYRPVKDIRIWSYLYALSATVVTGGLNLLNPFLTGSWSIVSALTTGIGILYFIHEFEGWSPLVKYNLQSIYKAAPLPEIAVNRELCTGCRLCIQVCPKGVFTITNGKSEAVNRNECIICSACYKRCPVKAIIHSSYSPG
ncbi:hypothetical protein ES707_12685 [subsurface metagenome]